MLAATMCAGTASVPPRTNASVAAPAAANDPIAAATPAAAATRRRWLATHGRTARKSPQVTSAGTRPSLMTLSPIAVTPPSASTRA